MPKEFAVSNRRKQGNRCPRVGVAVGADGWLGEAGGASNLGGWGDNAALTSTGKLCFEQALAGHGDRREIGEKVVKVRL
jgi:hypothetical protein